MIRNPVYKNIFECLPFDSVLWLIAETMKIYNIFKVIKKYVFDIVYFV